MWPFALVMGLATATQAPPPAATAATVHAGKQDTKTMKKSDATGAPPDLELIGYLADFGDADIGLDPMGLAEHDTAATAAAKARSGSPADGQP
jgi:hypothetical protein